MGRGAKKIKRDSIKFQQWGRWNYIEQEIRHLNLWIHKSSFKNTSSRPIREPRKDTKTGGYMGLSKERHTLGSNI